MKKIFWNINDIVYGSQSGLQLISMLVAAITVENSKILSDYRFDNSYKGPMFELLNKIQNAYDDLDDDLGRAIPYHYAQLDEYIKEFLELSLKIQEEDEFEIIIPDPEFDTENFKNALKIIKKYLLHDFIKLEFDTTDYRSLYNQLEPQYQRILDRI